MVHLMIPLCMSQQLADLFFQPLALCRTKSMRYICVMASGSSDKRLHAVFAGRVQGVGFRYTTCRLAQEFSVRGFIRNALNGTVELVAEGTEQELMDFLRSIRESWPGRNIVHEQLTWKQATGEYDGFGVSY